MPSKPRILQMDIPRTAKKPEWDGKTFYDTPKQVLPWLQKAFAQAMKENPEWGISGVPVGKQFPKFQMPEVVPGNFQIDGPAPNSPYPRITWFSPWSNTTWTMFLKPVRVVYKGTKPIKNG